MKLRTALLASVFMLAPVMVTGITYAEDSNSGSGSSGSGSTTTTTKTEDTTHMTAEQETEMKSRVETRKQQLKTKLTNVEKVKLQSKCKNSQGKLSSLNGRIKGISTSRGKVYENLVNRLASLDDKLMARGADTSKLMAEVDVLKAKIATYKSDLTAYELAVSDSSKLDCATDPTAFKASLEAARAAQQKVKQDIKDIRSYVNDTIKPTLKEIRATLDKQDGTTDDTTTTGGGTQ